MGETPGMVNYSYFSSAFTNTNRELAEEMRYATSGAEVKYDTIVGTGLSGTVFTARVAPTLRKVFAILRKEDDTSTHSGNRIEGRIGKRWVFADDFAETGNTLARVLRYMQENHPECEFQGMYSYERGIFQTPADLIERFEYKRELQDLLRGPVLGPKKPSECVYAPVLSEPVGGWSPEMKALVTDPGDLEVSWDNSDGQPTFYSYMRNKVYDPAEYPQFKPLARLVLASREAGAATWLEYRGCWSDTGRRVNTILAENRERARAGNSKLQPLTLGEALDGSITKPSDMVFMVKHREIPVETSWFQGV